MTFILLLYKQCPIQNFGGNQEFSLTLFDKSQRLSDDPSKLHSEGSVEPKLLRVYLLMWG